MTATDRLIERLRGPDGARRIGQALWMFAGGQIDPGALIWSRGLLGEDGDQLLWAALLEHGAVVTPDHVVDPLALAGFLCALWKSDRPTGGQARLVWTLPRQLGVPELEDSYLQAAVNAIAVAKETLWLVSPFLEARGLGRLLEVLLAALHRGVRVTLISHGIGAFTSQSSQALEQLRRDAKGASGSLTAYVVGDGEGLLVHSKLIVADSSILVLGSANLTEKGLGVNLEAGAVLGAEHAREALNIIDALTRSHLVHRAFSTGLGESHLK